MTPNLCHRKCSVTGEGMNQGWLFEGDHSTIKYESDVIAELRGPDWKDFWTDMKPPSERTDDEVLEAAFEQDICSWTDWDDDCSTEDDDVLYTHDGRELHTQRDRQDYLRGIPCTDPERVACVMIHEGYRATVTSGCDDVVMWNGKQRVLVESLLRDLSDGCFIDVRQEGEYWDEWLAEYWKLMHTAGTKKFNLIITNPSKYLFDEPNESFFGPMQRDEPNQKAQEQ
jgi:hypothetical protein